MFTSMQYGQSGLFLDDRTCLLLRMEGTNGGTNLSDNSGLHRVSNVNGATTSTVQYKTGSSSGDFEFSNQDYVDYIENLECRMADDFTIRFWVYFKTEPTHPANFDEYNRTVISIGKAGSPYAAGLDIYWDDRGFDTYVPRFFFWGGDYNGLYTTTMPTLQTWTHMEVCRYTTAAGVQTVEAWVDGVSVGSVTNAVSGIIGGGDPSYLTSVGCFTQGLLNNKFNFQDMYLDELQIINGTALHRDGVTFTPPAYEL